MSISAIDGNYDGKVTIRKGQGISQAIRDELGLTQKQCDALGKDGWETIFEEVKKNSTKAYTGGEDLFGDYRKNYKVKLGQEIEFDKTLWNNIVDIVNKKLQLNIEHVGDTSKKEQPAPVKKEKTEKKQEVKNSDPGKLTAGDWGRSLWKSSKKFVKNMFCNKDGKPSVWKIGLAAGTAVAAVLASGPTAIALGAVGITAGAVLAVKGIVDIVKGAKGIKAATTREDKLNALEKTTDGIVETTVGTGTAIGGYKMMKYGFKGIRTPKTTTETEVLPTEPETPALTTSKTETPALSAHTETTATTNTRAITTSKTKAPAVTGTKAETPALSAPSSKTPALQAPAQQTPALSAPSSKTPALQAPAQQTPALSAHTETPTLSAREMSIANRRAIAETGSTNPNTPVKVQPSKISKYNPADNNPTQVTRVYETGNNNPGTFADAKGGDQLAQLRSQVAAEEAAAQSSPQAQAAARATRAQENVANMRKGTENKPLTSKETGKKIRAIRKAEKAQSAAASAGANRTVTRFSTNSNAKVSYVFKNNNLVEVRIPQGNGKATMVLKTPKSIQQHLFKNGISEAELV